MKLNRSFSVRVSLKKWWLSRDLKKYSKLMRWRQAGLGRRVVFQQRAGHVPRPCGGESRAHTLWDVVKLKRHHPARHWRSASCIQHPVSSQDVLALVSSHCEASRGRFLFTQVYLESKRVSFTASPVGMWSVTLALIFPWLVTSLMSFLSQVFPPSPHIW